MDRNLVCSLALFLLAAGPVFAHDFITTKLTWNREISRMVYKRCAGCHREGGTAMSLVTYDEARPWAKAIRDQVVARAMPPWGAVKGVGSFQQDPSLTEVEIQMIVAWVEGGAPKGDEAAVPYKPPVAAKPLRTVSNKIQTVSRELTLDKPLLLAGVRPEALGDGRSMFVDAFYPDGRVEHLIWLRNYQNSWTRDYLYRQPLKLPVGTVIRIKSPGPAKLQLLY